MKTGLFAALFFFLVCGVVKSQDMDTIGSYSSFRFYNGEQDTVFLDHPRYFGFFRKDTCSEENFATTVRSGGSCYRRISSNYSPRFFEFGRQSLLPILNSKMENELDAINSAAYLAYISGGDTIEIDSLYLIDGSVYLFDHNTYFGTHEEAGFRRMDPPKTTLTNTAVEGDNRISVASNAGFRRFHKINIAGGKAYDQLSSFSSYTAAIPFQNSSELLLNGPKIQNSSQKGDTVSLLYPMMIGLFGSSDHVTLENLTFDGNRRKNNLSYDWRVGTTIVTQSSDSLLIKGCRFWEIPSENMFICGATLIDCEGVGFNGSVAHFSCQEGDFRTEVLYNNFSGVNEVGDAIMEHSEGALTFSAKVQNLRVAYNRIGDISEKGLGDISGDDFDLEVTDNLLDSEEETIGYIAFYDKDSLNTIYNNKNLNNADVSDDACILRTPLPLTSDICAGFSSVDDPLEIGDSITIVLDSLWMRNSNENYVKCIEPMYSDEFFRLVDISLNVSGLSEHHAWRKISEANICDGLAFDNGHRDGLFAQGNWGFEGCSTGKCTELALTFEVYSLPQNLGEVDCPLMGLRYFYDGELDTWEHEIACSKESIAFEGTLGKPILNAVSGLEESEVKSFVVFPNPVVDFVSFSDKVRDGSKFRIVGVDGREVAIGVISGRRLDLSEVPSGIYFMSMWVQGKLEFTRFVKE